MMASPRFEPGNLRIVTASPSISVPAYGERWMAAGDAAAAWDPLSSQGLTNAIASGMHAAHAIANGTCGAPAAAVESAFHEHLALRSMFYERESRWRLHPFWGARQGSSTPSTATPAHGQPSQLAGAESTAPALLIPP